MKKIYIVRHCEAEGQPPEANLTEQGREQSMGLEKFFKSIHVDRILSSPYKRAIQSIEPLSEKRGIEIEIEQRLSERVLSTKSLDDWLEKLKVTFENLSISYEGGESSQAAMERIVEVVEELLRGPSHTSIIVTHGNVMSLLLKYYTNNFGFEEWKNLRNPDVYLLTKNHDKLTIEGVWDSKK